MTDSEKLDAILARLDKPAPAPILGPDGNRILPAAAPGGFDWAGLWTQVGPYVFRIATLILVAAATYLGIDTKQETRVNGEKIAAVHQEVKAAQSAMYLKAPE